MALTRRIVFEPPGEAGAGERAVFVRDRFSLLAFLFPFLWLFRYGLWISGLVVLALSIAIGVAGEATGHGWAAFGLEILVGVLVALEGPSLRAGRLRHKGWREAAAVQAAGRAEAEVIYYMGSVGAADGTPSEPAAAPALLPWAGRAGRSGEGRGGRGGGFFGALR